MTRRIFFTILLIIVILFIAGCDAHDYWMMSQTIDVNSEEGILYAESEDPISQDLFVRYQLDYELKNLNESQVSEVVVSATSFVNSVARSTGQKVWHLNPGETAKGILTTSQLQLGNSLVISLSGCTTSRCSRKEVLCPESLDDLPDATQIAEFCYNACEDTTSCLASCPAETSCQEYCSNPVNETECRETNCGYGGSLSTCSHICKDDPECIDNCVSTPECTEKCISLRATCFRNCTATWTQCTEEFYLSDTSLIPCALCGGEGLCQTDFDTTETETHILTGTDGKTYECDFNCSSYPASCVTGCDELYTSTDDRMQCLDVCLQQFLFWCNDYSISIDYVDSSGKQPCCFNSFCQAKLTGVIKSYDVECFNDTSCGTGSSCSAEGICVSNGSSSCSSMPYIRNSNPWPLWLLFTLPLICLRRKEKYHEKASHH